jgi:hypothetical protein
MAKNKDIAVYSCCMGSLVYQFTKMACSEVSVAEYVCATRLGWCRFSPRTPDRQYLENSEHQCVTAFRLLL